MVETLKEIYLANKAASILIEALDEADLQVVTQIIKKLRDLKSFGLPSLNAGIETAIKELNAHTGGGTIAKVWDKLKTKVGLDNPVVKAMAFASALENGISQLPTLVKNAVDIVGDPETFGEKTLTQILTLPGGDGGKGIPVDGKKKLKLLSDTMMKALVPPGRLNAFGLPYVKTKDLIKDLTNTKLANLDAFHNAVTKGASASNLVKTGVLDTIANPSGGQPAEQSPQPTKKVEPGAADEPGKATQTTPPAQQPATAQPTIGGAEVTGGEPGTKPATKKPAAAKGKVKFPDFAAALKSAEIPNINSAGNEKVKAAFEKFYNYLISNVTV